MCVRCVHVCEVCACVCVCLVCICPHNFVSPGCVVASVVLLEHKCCPPHAKEPATLEEPTHPPLDKDNPSCQCYIAQLLQKQIVRIL